MVQLFSLTNRWYPNQKVAFSRYELNQILSIYGMRVSKGEWKDYALDSTTETAMFSIFLHAHEKPVFIITKMLKKGFKRQAKFAVYMENKTLSQGDTILEVLQVFHETDKKNGKNKNK